MYKKINKNRFGVIEYAIDTEEDLDNIRIDNTDNTVYAVMNNDGKELIYLYSSHAKKWILINDVQEEINSINEQLETNTNNISSFINISMFDGQNDTERFKNAISYVKDKKIKLILNAENYYITESLVIDFSNFNLEGSGKDTKIISKITDNSPVFYLKPSNTDGFIKSVFIRNLNIVSETDGEKTTAIKIEQGQRCLFSDIYITKMKKGIYVCSPNTSKWSASNIFERIECNLCDIGLQLGDDNNGQVNANQVIECNFFHDYGTTENTVGIIVKNGDNNYFIGGDIEGYAKAGDLYRRYTTLIRVRQERNTNNIILNNESYCRVFDTSVVDNDKYYNSTIINKMPNIALDNAYISKDGKLYFEESGRSKKSVMSMVGTRTIYIEAPHNLGNIQFAWGNSNGVKSVRLECVQAQKPYLDFKDTMIKVPNTTSALPTASETYRGMIIGKQGGTGVEDKLYICKKLSDDSYSWVQIDI